MLKKIFKPPFTVLWCASLFSDLTNVENRHLFLCTKILYETAKV